MIRNILCNLKYYVHVSVAHITIATDYHYLPGNSLGINIYSCTLVFLIIHVPVPKGIGWYSRWKYHSITITVHPVPVWNWWICMNLYTHVFFWEWMFLDSGNIISDETFCTQSQIMVEKVPEFSAESLCLRQGTVTWSRRVMWHQRPLVTIPWRRQRDSAKNLGTFSILIWLCVQNVSSETCMYSYCEVSNHNSCVSRANSRNMVWNRVR